MLNKIVLASAALIGAPFALPASATPVIWEANGNSYEYVARLSFPSPLQRIPVDMNFA